MQTTVRTRDGVETVDSSRTVERSESKSEEGGQPAAKWLSLRTLLFLLVLIALGVGVYFLLTSQPEFSAEKVRSQARLSDDSDLGLFYAFIRFKVLVSK
jgi:hypothetical protein